MKRAHKSERHTALSQAFPPDPDLLLSTGAITGPYRKTRPVTLTWRVRITRWVRSLNLWSPL
jgi:hypothetical protein